MMLRAAFAVVLAAALVLRAAPAVATEDASADDMARFLAGLPVDPGSPLAPATRDGAWQDHARRLSSAWEQLEQGRLGGIRKWAQASLDKPQETLFYMFSGPDYLYANAFFPKARTIVMSGLEPTGPIPSIAGRRSPGMGLSQLRASLGSVMSLSFFRTIEMRATLGDNAYRGTLPLLYIFLARAGMTVEHVTLFDVDEDGSIVRPGEGSPNGAAQGARIGFSDTQGDEGTLYYVRTDVSNSGLAQGGFLEFLKEFGRGDAFVKSASFLMHSNNFSQIRSFLLENAQRIVQDDSGIPVVHFQAHEWSLVPYGRYLGPIDLFANHYQSRLADLYRRANPPAIDFGIGYRYRPSESNLLVAERLPRKAD